MRYNMEEYTRRIRQGAAEYNFPAKTYDFEEETESEHRAVSCVERLIRSQLTSESCSQVKDGLSNVLYWGYIRRQGIRDRRVCQFRAKVTDAQLHAFIERRRRSTCMGLEELKQLGLPEFSKMSFSTKVSMFMCPDSYPVLDRSIALFAHDQPAQSLDRPSGLSALLKLKLYPTTIPLNGNNMRVYREWSGWCCEIADAVNAVVPPDVNLRAVDVERAIFWCIDRKSDTEARRLLLGPK